MDQPASHVDPFGRETLYDPYPFYSALREAGGAVWLEAIGCHALSRYEDVKEALRDWRTFSSASGVALDPLTNMVLSGTTLASDNPVHAEKRKVIGRPLAPARVRDIQDRIAAEADQLIASLIESGGVADAVRDIAWHLPLTIVSHFVGLPKEGRERMLHFSAATSNVTGPDYEASDDAYRARKAAGISVIGEMVAYLQAEATRERLAPDGWGAMLYDAADRGEIDHADVMPMLNDYLAPSLDTTISATGSMIWLLTQHPEQWRLLQKDRSLVAKAVVEAVRLETPIQWFTRVLTHDHEIDGVTIGAGQRVMLLYGSANRDERKYQRADCFDVTRGADDQLGWGHGVHSCVGMYLARTEMEAVLNALLDRVDRIELAEPPERLESTGFRAFRRLPVILHR